MARRQILETIISMAGNVDSSVRSAFSEVQDRINALNEKAQAVKESFEGINACILKAAKAGGYLVRLGDEYNLAMGSVMAKTNTTAKEMEEIANVTKNVYRNNFGESISEVADTTAIMHKYTGAVGDDLKALTEGSFILKNTFGYEAEEISSAANVLMDSFDISGAKAMDIIAAGARNGLDSSGELLDNISKYSLEFKNAEKSAEEMFQALSGSDKAFIAGDEINSIKSLLDNDVEGAVNGLKRRLETELMPIGSELSNRIMGSMPQITAALEQGMPAIVSFASLFSEKIATIATGLIDLGIRIAPIAADVIMFATSAIGVLCNNLNWLAPIVVSIAGLMGGLRFSQWAIGVYQYVTAEGALLIAKIKDKIETAYLLALYAKDAIAKGVSTAATWAQTTATTAWNVVAGVAAGVTSALGTAFAILTGPIGLVIAAIVGVVSAGVWLYRNWDTLKATAASLGAYLYGVWTNISFAVSGFIEGIKAKFMNGFYSLIGIIKAPINAVISIINSAIGAINGISVSIPSWVPGVGGQTFGASIPTIPLLAGGGFTNGVSIAGEEGMEAVISFDRGVRKENLNYWARAGRMLGALPDNQGLTGSKSSRPIEIGNISFAPRIEISGGANKEDVIAAIKEEYPEFIDLLEQWLFERGRFIYEN